MLGHIFEVEGEHYLPTELARGPWDPNALHGGPLAGLLAREVERLAPGRLIARLTFEFLRPGPLRPMTVSARVVREGRSVTRIRGRIATHDHDIVEVNAVALRRAPVQIPSPHEEPPPGPEFGKRPPDPPTAHYPAFYNEGMEIRFVRGSWSETGPALAWFRMAVPLVPGEEPSALVRVAAASDFSNGSSTVVPWQEFTFINPDLTIYLTREPVGEWICLDASTQPGPDGTGVAMSRIHDQKGQIGTTLQSVLFSPLTDSTSPAAPE